MDNVQILVTPDVLVQKSQDVTTKINKVRVLFEELQKLVEDTQAYWIGEGGDKHRSNYTKYYDDVETILKRLSEHPKDLLEMAGLYVEVEQGNVEIAQALPSDVIF